MRRLLFRPVHSLIAEQNGDRLVAELELTQHIHDGGGNSYDAVCVPYLAPGAHSAWALSSAAEMIGVAIGFPF
jgi:hypothetical protein